MKKSKSVIALIVLFFSTAAGASIAPDQLCSTMSVYQKTPSAIIDNLKRDLESGANPSVRCYTGASSWNVPLSLGLIAYALAHEESEKKIAIDLVQILLDHQADPNGIQRSADKKFTRHAVLDLAVQVGNIEIVRLLVNHGANPNLLAETEPHKQPTYALKIAVERNQWPIVEILLHNGHANLNQQDMQRGNTLLLDIIGAGYPTALNRGDGERLIDLGIDVNIANARGWTALCLATTNDHFLYHGQNNALNSLIAKLQSLGAVLGTCNF